MLIDLQDENLRVLIFFKIKVQGYINILRQYQVQNTYDSSRPHSKTALQQCAAVMIVSWS